MEEKTIESSLFTWEDWDAVDAADFVFYHVELVRDIGQFKKGHRFHVANLLLSKSTLELIENSETGESVVFGLKLEII